MYPVYHIIHIMSEIKHPLRKSVNINFIYLLFQVLTNKLRVKEILNFNHESRVIQSEWSCYSFPC